MKILGGEYELDRKKRRKVKCVKTELWRKYYTYDFHLSQMVSDEEATEFPARAP